MSGNSAKVREKSGNLCSQGYLIVSPWRNACDVHGHMLRTSYNLPVLYSYFTAFCTSGIQHFELTLISAPKFVTSRFYTNKCAFVRCVVCLSSGKVGFFSVWRVVTLCPNTHHLNVWSKSQMADCSTQCVCGMHQHWLNFLLSWLFSFLHRSVSALYLFDERGQLHKRIVANLFSANYQFWHSFNLPFGQIIKPLFSLPALSFDAWHWFWRVF